MGADLDGIQQVHCKVLAVVADEVVGLSLLLHVVDCHSTYKRVSVSCTQQVRGD